MATVKRCLPAMAAAFFLCVASQPALPLSFGDPVPAFTRPGLMSEGVLNSRQLGGRVVYLDFWASWCGPCRVSLPALDELYRELGNQGFVVIAVNLDEERAAGRQFLRQFPVSYPVLQGDGQLSQQMGVDAMPTGFLLDRQSRVRAVHKGFRQGDKALLRRQIMQLLAEPAEGTL